MLKQDNYIIINTNAQHFRIYNKRLGLKRLKCLVILKKNELYCDTKEENMDSTDSALDEIVSSFLHEFLSIFTRFLISVGFFSLIK